MDSCNKDNTDYGLLYYNKFNRLLYINKMMIDLYLSLFGQMDFSGERLLSHVQMRGMTINIQDKAYEFILKEYDNYKAIIAIDTTYEESLIIELKEKQNNKRLLNKRLVEYGNQSDILLKDKEILDTKIRVHDEIGKALLLTKHYKETRNEDDYNTLLSMWKDISTMNIEKNENTDNNDVLRDILEAAEAIGISIEINGDLSNLNDRAISFMVLASRESLTNISKHTESEKLCIDIKEEKDRFVLRFYDDSLYKGGQIKLGGGLSSLKKYVEDEGGLFRILYEDHLVIRIEAPIREFFYE